LDGGNRTIEDKGRREEGTKKIPFSSFGGKTEFQMCQFGEIIAPPENSRSQAFQSRSRPQRAIFSFDPFHSLFFASSSLFLSIYIGTSP
jgi:hypothetical protein